MAELEESFSEIEDEEFDIYESGPLEEEVTIVGEKDEHKKESRPEYKSGVQEGKIYIKKAATVGNLIFGSIKFGVNEEGEIRLFINMDVPLGYEVLGFKQVSRELKKNKDLLYFDSKSVANTTFLMSGVMQVKNWQKYISIAPKILLQNMVFATLQFSMIFYESSKDDLEVILRVGKRFEKYGNITNLDIDSVNFNHKLFIFGTEVLKPYFQENVMNLLKDINSYDYSQLDALSVNRISSLKEWQTAIKGILKDMPDVEPSSEVVDKINILTTNLELNEDLRKEEHSKALREMRRPEPRKYRERKKELIESFFGSLGIVKSLGEKGIVYSMNSLPSLLNFCQKLMQNKSLSRNDKFSLIGCRDRLIKIIDEGETLPLATIQQQVKTLWDKLISFTNGDGEKALSEIRQKFLESNTYEEAWMFALRMKGVAYEVLFAYEYGLNFVQENFKMSLANFIYNVYPDLYNEFLRRSCKNTYIRDLKPDFILYEKPMDLRPEGLNEWIQKFYRPKLDEDRIEPESEDQALLIEERKYTPSRQKPEKGGALVEKILEAVKTKKGEFCKLEKNFDESCKTERNLTVIEVGYQTASESKVISDIEKWKPAKEIMRSLGFDFTIVSVADSTKGIRETTWLSLDKGKLLFSTIGATFGKMTSNMPPGLTDISVGSISTQKLRSRISTDHKRKTPVTEFDLIDYHAMWKETIFKRPSGVIVPPVIQKQFVRNLVLGSTTSKSDAIRVLNIVKNSGNDIIKYVKSSNLRFEIIDENSWGKFLFGCYEEDIISFSKSKCNTIGPMATSTLRSWAELSKEVSQDTEQYKTYSASLDLRTIELEKSINDHNYSEKHECNINLCKSSWLRPILVLLCTNDILEQGIKSNPKKSILDRLCGLTLAGRTGRQKESKGLVIRLIEGISRSTKGFLKDSRGLLMSPYRDILKKCGLSKQKKDRDGDGIESSLGMRKPSKEKDNFLSPEKSCKNVIKFVSEKITAILKKSDSLNPESIATLKELADTFEKSQIEQREKKNCDDFLKEIGLNSYVEDDNLSESLFELLKDTIHTSPVNLTFEGQTHKVEKFRNMEDPRYCITEIDSILDHISSLLPLLEVHEDVNLTMEIIDPVIMRAVEERIEGIETSMKILEDIKSFCEIIMSTNFGKSLYAYMKVCETFLNFTSEMSYSGIKIMKIKSCNLNLLCKVNKNKVTNCSCMILDLDYRRLTKPFFLNRNRATLGQSYLYCMIVNMFQCNLTQGGYDFIRLVSPSTCLSMIRTNVIKFTDNLLKIIKSLYTEGLNKTVRDYNCTFNFTGDSPLEIGVRTLSCMIVNYTLILTCSLLNNSRKISKLTQMIRYPNMLCLSEFGFPKGVGNKLDTSIRKIEDHILKKFICFVSAVNIKNVKSIINNWVDDEPHNARRVLSLELFPHCCKSPRQLVSDKYICHFYNKEDDNYSEGSIRVLNEVCDKILDWEKELERHCIEYKELCLEQDKNKVKLNKEKVLSSIRSLMGIKNTSIKEKDVDEEWLVTDGINESSGSGESKTDADSTSSKSSYRKKEYYLTHSDDLESTSAAGSTHLSERIPSKSKIDPVNSRTVKYQIKKVCENMAKYTYGCPEICQAFAELAKKRYTPFNTVNALKGRRNNEQISKITETTSIVSEPHPSFSLESSISSLLMRDSIKLVKTISRTNRSTMSNNLKYRSFEREMSKILLMDDEDRDKNLLEFQKRLETLKKENRLDWKSIISMDMDRVLLTDNCSHLFIFIKSVWKRIRNMCGKDRKEISEKCNLILKENIDMISKQKNQKIYRYNINTSEERIWLDSKLSSMRRIIFEEIFKIFLKSRNTTEEDFISNLIGLNEAFLVINADFIELETMKKEYPGASFPDIERGLMETEDKIMREYNEELFLICLMISANESINHFTLSTESFNTIYLRDVKTFILKYCDEENLKDECIIEADIFLGNFYNSINNKNEFKHMLIEKFNILDSQILNRLINYCELLCLNIRRPISMRLLDVSKGLTSLTDLMDALKGILTKSSYKETDFDFSITMTSCIKGSLQMCRKLLDRREKGIKLPRGTRSKVIFEMVKLTKTMGTTCVQELGFQISMNSANRFYAGIAPKAQIGGDRDLLVMSTEMKVATHCTESCSKSLMENSVNNDGLVNKNLKEQILDKARDNMLIKRRSDEALSKSEKKNFIKVINIAGDNSKWGPIHCTSYFSILMQQILSEFPDWANFYKLIMLKSLNKQLEIPSAALEKIIHSLVMNGEFRKKIRGLKTVGNEKEKRKIMGDTVDAEWKNNEIVKSIVKWYLKDGKSFIDSYNHMGQGIHHATSSLFANACQFVIDEIIQEYLLEKFPGCTVDITHAGSSDDFAKTICISGVLENKLFETYNDIYKTTICDCLNLMMGIMRCNQMLVSEKTVVSPIVAEFYSEFCYHDKVSPSPKKFLTSQIINNSVTSPVTLYQATHVECQQAMYMGIPLASIFMLALFKQNIFFSNSIEIYRQYGNIVLNSVSTIGRIYVPKYSMLTTDSASIDDLITLQHSCEVIYNALLMVKGVSKLKMKLPTTKALTADEKIAFLFGAGMDRQSSSDESALNSSDEILLGSSSGELGSESTATDENIEEIISEKNLLPHILTLIMFRYYSTAEDFQNEEGFEKTDMWSASTLLKDPFVQMLPESIRSKIEQLKGIKSEMRDIREVLKDPKNSLKTIALNLIAKNSVTEDYDFEVGRLQQALESANIIWGLAGGIRSISVSIHRQMMRSFHFENRTPIIFKDTWVSNDRSKFLSGSGGYVEPTKRIRYSSFLDAIKNIIVNKVCIDDEPKTVTDVPIYIDYLEDKIRLNVDNFKLSQYMELLSKIISELKDSNHLNLEMLEESPITEIEVIRKPTIKKTRLIKAEKLTVIRNNPAIIAAAIINQDALYESRPIHLEYSYIGVDINALENNFPIIVKMIKDIKLEQEKAKNNENLEQITRSNISKLVATCRVLSKQRSKYQKLFLLSEQEEETNTTDSKILFMYNTIENIKIVSDSTHRIRFQDAITHTYLGVINCINWYLENPDEKNDILNKFLRCNPKLLCEKLRDNLDCYFNRLLENIYNQIPEGTVENLFFTESKNVRSVKKSKTLNVLYKWSTSPEELIRGSETQSYQTHIDFRGTIESGTFSFYSSEGTATGYIKNQIVFIMLSNTKSSLLTSLEDPILKIFNKHTNTAEIYNSREQFFRLLPKVKEYRKRITGNYLSVFLNSDASFSITGQAIRPENSIGDPRVCFLSTGNLVAKYSKPINSTRSLSLKWTANSLYMISEVHVNEVTPADSLERNFNNALLCLGEEQANKIREAANNSVQKNLIHKINLSDPVSQQSIALFHCLMKHYDHALEKTYKIEVSRWESLEVERVKKLSRDTLESKLKKGSSPGSTDFYNEKLEPLISRMTGLDTVWPINFLLDYYGYTHMTIDFKGISEKRISSLGKWEINPETRFQINKLQRILDNIQKLSEKKITRETIAFLNLCNLSGKDVEKVIKFNTLIEHCILDRPLMLISIYLTSVYLALNLEYKLKNISIRTSTFVQSLAESNPSINYKLNEFLELGIKREINTDKTFDMKFYISIKTIDESAVKPEKGKIRSTVDHRFPFLKTVFKTLGKVRPDLIDDSYTFEYQIITFCSNFICMELIAEICEKRVPDKYLKEVKRLLFFILNLCVEGDVNAELLPDKLKAWYLQGLDLMSVKLDKREIEKLSEHQKDVDDFMNDSNESDDEEEVQEVTELDDLFDPDRFENW